MKRVIAGIFFVMMMTFCLPITARAASGSLQLSALKTTVGKGSQVTVVCQVTSTESFADVSFRLSYDASILTFLSGGNKVSGGNGMLDIASTGNTTEVPKKTFSLQFKAKKKGTTVIRTDGDIAVTNASGEKFSMSSNQVTVSVVKKGKKTSSDAAVSPKATDVPLVTAPPVKSKENRIKNLKLHAVSMTPEFSPEVLDYEASVDADADSLYYSYALQDEKARMSVRGGDNLSEGENDVSFIVTAEDGSVREYKVTVTKETKEQTEQREDEENDKASVGFKAEQKGDRIILKNSYEFEVANPDELKQVPQGYIQSSIELNGITIPAFTMEHDLDNNYLLLYLKGNGKDAALYQYDRTEQTIQKYTGTMVERVNKGETAGDNSGFPVSTTVLMAVIIVLIVIVLCLLITMLKMAMKRRGKEGKELDF